MTRKGAVGFALLLAFPLQVCLLLGKAVVRWAFVSPHQLLCTGSFHGPRAEPCGLLGVLWDSITFAAIAEVMWVGLSLIPFALPFWVCFQWRVIRAERAAAAAEAASDGVKPFADNP